MGGTDGGPPLDFGDLTPVFWSLVFVGGLLIVTVTAISCVSCYLCARPKTQSRRQQRLSSGAHCLGDFEISSFLRPPPTNPNYAATPQISRRISHRQHDNVRESIEPSLPPSDSAPPSYAEAIQVSLSHLQTKHSSLVISVSQGQGLTPSPSFRSSVLTEPSHGPMEPSAPYPTLPHIL